MWSIPGVLMNVAEVTIPFRRLAQEEHQRVMHGIYKVLTNSPDDCDDEEKQIGYKAIGIIDGFFAEQEISLEESAPDEFAVRCQQELILNFRSLDVLFVGRVRDNNTRVIFVTRNPSFGRAAVLLQFKSSEDASKVEEKMKHGRKKRSITHGKDESVPSEQNVLSRISSFLTPPKKGQASTLTREAKQSDFYLADESLSDGDEDESTTSEGLENLPEDTTPQSPTASPEKAPDPQRLIEAEINYILETEHKYVDVLISLEEMRRTLAGTAPPDIRKWLSQLFRQVKSLAITHENLLRTLCEANYDIKKFSEAFVTHNKQFRYYVYFIENIPTVDKIINEFSDYFKEHVPDLIGKLRQPRLRLNHYVLMLESLQKKVDHDHKNSMQEAINLCKKYLKEADQGLLLTSIKGCPFQVSQCGDLIFKSELKLSASPDLPNIKYSVLLMEKKLLIVLGKLDNLEFVHSIPVDEIFLRENARGLYFTLFASNEDRGTGSKRYTFKATNIRLQQEWLCKLNKATTSAKKKLESSNTRASFGRSAKKLRKRLTIPRSLLKDSTKEIESTSTSSDESTSSKQYWIERRKNYKKFSSHREKQSLTMYSPGSLSDGEESPCIRHGMAPLTVWNFFQKLESVYLLLGNVNRTNDARMQWIFKERNEAFLMNAIENKYVEELRKQLGTFLNEDAKPPKPIQKDIKHLFELHNEKLYPHIENYDNVEQGFLETLTKYGEDIAALYSEFLINRCTFHEEMMCMDLSDNFVFPLQHFMKYCIGVILIRRETKVENKMISTAATILHDTITNANNYLMAECINNAPFALSQCEPISLLSRLRVKIDNKSKNECEVVLVKDRLFILEIQPPLYNCICSLQLDCVSLGPGSGKLEFQLIYGTSATAKKVYTFRTTREDIIDRWTTEIRLILTEQALNLKLALSHRLEQAPSLTVGETCSLAVNHTVDISRSPAVKSKNVPREPHSLGPTDNPTASPNMFLSRSPAMKKKTFPSEPETADEHRINILKLAKSPRTKKKSLPQDTACELPVIEKFI